MLQAPPGPGLVAELARAGGNPLYARRIVRALLTGCGFDRFVSLGLRFVK
ncbi:hypothetical protein [Dactylosporangium sp. CA-233914]